MRLRPEEAEAIRAAAVETFGPEATVRLFGSRVRDDLRGGDIDLHLEVGEGQQDVRHAARFRWLVFDRLDERALDLVIHVRGRPLRPIDRVAHAEGIVL